MGDNDSKTKLEPVFTIDLDTPVEPSYQREREPAPAPSPLQQEINLLQPQIDDISRAPAQSDLSTNQIEVLRKYIALKEAESRDLKEQQKQFQTVVRRLTAQLQTSTGKNHELVTELETTRRREEAARHDLTEHQRKHQEDLTRLKNEYEDQIQRSGNVSAEYQELDRKREEWKDKVREDLKRIKLKERELENKYELLKRDTQALLDSKDKHVLELKRKNDALELEMESLEDRLRNATAAVSAVEA
ncbi:hypothetical protein K2X33_02270, partial [bacterium]|nr:hypothetical protein [bacterium]